MGLKFGEVGGHEFFIKIKAGRTIFGFSSKTQGAKSGSKPGEWRHGRRAPCQARSAQEHTRKKLSGEKRQRTRKKLADAKRLSEAPKNA